MPASGLSGTHRRAIRDRSSRLDVHVETDRFVPRRADLDPVRAGFEVQLLQHAVEVVHIAGEVSVHVHLRVALRQVDPDASVRPNGDVAAVTIAWVTISGIWIRGIA